MKKITGAILLVAWLICMFIFSFMYVSFPEWEIVLLLIVMSLVPLVSFMLMTPDKNPNDE